MNTQLSEAYLQRFGGTARLYGQQALALFSQAHVCVIGIGGVGSWAAEALARTGIGAITLIDMDDVCVSNTNRQIHALRQHTGQSKTEVMAERILAINPECHVTCVDDFISAENVAELLDQNFSYVIDAIDSVRPKAALLSYCRRYKIPVVTTGGAGGQIDPTRIEVVDLAKTIQDPLAAKLRERLKHDFNVVKNSKGKLGIDCVFSSEPLVYPQPDGSVCASRSTADGAMRMDCASGFGAATMVTATFGFVAVSHALKKMIAKRGRSSAAQK
ncbi:tRNA cyclic N6-threonylcarbamoyladenosine(37) synthase TcdA [Pectobacterium parmentieri]|uniref:tRNA cyclic N6-threonylcarbamoyladenosine(37) synthase TcdA n=1 Tax=Pectobacterium parmentieri TaxID=1905730 RepID=UPI000CDE5219|nr:tRNA cyclic N6-threonylcarbamoyladenosine(37) synthase TcdA [Pectobacterium parmentieri]AYH02519.1 tRNA cyclic N6-threonylcarbamoyladenosine(37) synthase TcdA [Pectobacterium parmentieri]AYH06783.1 tRNA cyclic N6-threonylcarbamoyladenosine(37) synthase TcdA [Pectobacterium parmentieri]AYH15597.1 tRNA cyclic N6-threonylcarbamoyladenosine(37) synthase TcdA [Pectobacterium parmentieri]AYH24302.1 tRNA cyclic N6-threonylcarbamoyladenosine(37) synthase TcdA [Pectobacterium parmentieri]AYH28784.1 